MSNLTPRDAAKALLKHLALPMGVVSIMPAHQGGDVTMTVFVAQEYMNRISAPTDFEGYKVVVQERKPVNAY